MTNGHPKRHHYVPQFYLRRFACPEDSRKVRVLEQHRDVLISDIKSIDRIGYEESIHDFVEDGVVGSIEGSLNRAIETPFSNGPTWKKIADGTYANLDETDKIPIYGFARHLQRRNLEMLRFIEAESARFRAGTLNTHLSEEEREIHEWIAASANNAHAIFRKGAMDTTIPEDATVITIMVCRSPIPLRTSTNPTLPISEPGQQSAFGKFFNNLRTWWLTFDRQCGAFIIVGGSPGFTNTSMSIDAARMINRQYLVQHCNSLTVRYMIGDDDYLNSDLEWAGYRFERRTTHGARWHKKSILI